MAEDPLASTESQLKRFASVCSSHARDTKYCDSAWWNDFITKTVYSTSTTAKLVRCVGCGWTLAKQKQLVQALLQAEPSANAIFEWRPSTGHPMFNPHQPLGALCEPSMKKLKTFLEKGKDISKPEDFSSDKLEVELEKQMEASTALSRKAKSSSKKRRGTKFEKHDAHEGVSNYILKDGQSSRLQNQNGYVTMDHGYLTGYNAYGETRGIGMENGNDFEFGLVLLSSLSILLVIFIAGVLCGFGGFFIAKRFDCKCAVKNKEEKEDIIELSL
eukprot:464038_1